MLDRLSLLRTMGLLKKDNSLANVSHFSPRSLDRILAYYLQASRTNATKDMEAAATNSSGLAAFISSISAQNAPLSLLPSSLLYDRVIVDDPLLHLAIARENASSALVFGTGSSSTVSKAELVNCLNYFASLAPLIHSGVVTVLPLSLAHYQPMPRDAVPIRYDPDGYRSVVPPGLYEYVHKRAVVTAIKLDVESGQHILLPDDKRLLPGICIAFDGDPDYTKVSFYNYFVAHGIRDQGNEVTEMHLSHSPDVELSESVYRDWVEQSVNQSVGERIDAVTKELVLSNRFTATYLTESEFEAHLLGCSSDRTQASRAADAINFLNANLGSLQLRSAQTVADLRDKHAGALTNFRASLMTFAMRAREVDDFSNRANEIFASEVEPAVRDLERGLSKTLTAVAKGAIAGIATVGFGIATGTAVPFIAGAAVAASMGLSEALPTLSEYRASRNRPEFIWSKIVK